MRNEYIYQIYLFCDPFLLVLENDSIIDFNIDKISNISNKEDILKLEIKDKFFYNKLRTLEEKDFLLVLQTYDLSKNFLNQLELFGEDFNIESNFIIFKFKSSISNKTFPSLSPYWKNAIELYKKERVSYLRNSVIENILN